MDFKEKEKVTGGPVVVDLDGTLVRTDILVELLLRFAKEDFLALWKCGWWLRKGKAYFKRKLISKVTISVETLPYRKVVIDYLKEVKASGRKVVLATASDVRLAQKIANHLNLFDEVIGSDGKTNMGGGHKARTLADKFGKKKFEYIGNSNADIPVWEEAKIAHIVSNSAGLRRRVQIKTEIGMCWMSWYASVGAITMALRPYQWVKNLLVFLPMLADHQLELVVFGKASAAFIVFGLTASSVYVVNDLLDIEADRQHIKKKNRPFASGSVPVWVGFIIVPLFLGTAGIFMAWLPSMFMVIVFSYFTLNLFYSFGIKQIVLLDVIVLAVLYTLRVLAGGEVVGVAVSAWLMALILFLALSGALMKRYVELSRNGDFEADRNLAGRGYLPSDITIVGQLGIISGYLSVLVLALYVNSSQVRELYRLPEYWWLVSLLLLYAVSRGWLYAYRGKIDDDPIMYILKDPINYWILGLTVFLVLLAA